MITAPRLSLVVLASTLCLTLFACKGDEPATITPRSGTWNYEEEAVVSNTCSDVLNALDPLTTFNLDYDGGDSFQVEQGEDDIMCEIDGSEFTCAEWTLTPYMVPTLDAILNFSVNWSGEFTSDEIASGDESLEVTCTGEDCDMIDMVPCLRVNTWTAGFAS